MQFGSAAETHLTIVFKHQQQGAQVRSNTQHCTNTMSALPADRETTQTAAKQTGTTMPTRLSHLFYCSSESGTKTATPPIRYRDEGKLSPWIQSTTFAWGSPKIKISSRSASMFALSTSLSSQVSGSVAGNTVKNEIAGRTVGQYDKR